MPRNKPNPVSILRLQFDLLFHILHKRKPEIVRKMTESRSGAENIQDQREAPCHSVIKKGLKYY